MSIKTRLYISNTLMILVPVLITISIIFLSFNIFKTLYHGKTNNIEEDKDFYKIGNEITEIFQKNFEYPNNEHQNKNTSKIIDILDENNLSLAITSNENTLFTYKTEKDFLDYILKETEFITQNGIITNNSKKIYINKLKINGTLFNIYLYGDVSQLSEDEINSSLTIIITLSFIFALLSIVLLNRFLTKLIFKRIEKRLNTLVKGVSEIKSGNLDYRIDSNIKDEFSYVCNDFNDMAKKLKDFVDIILKDEQNRKELMVGISHDIRSPLTSIRAYVEGLIDGVASTPNLQKKYLSVIQQKTEEIDSLVSRIFLFSKLDMGNVQNNPVNINLNEKINEFININKDEYSNKGLKIIYTCNTPINIKIDTTELFRIFSNIAENTIKYSAINNPQLIISTIKKETTVLIELADNGKGVSKENLPKLFDVFYRCDVSRNNTKNGNGIGLAIVEKTIKNMGGTVNATNNAYGGLSIIIELPLPEEELN